MQSLAELAVGDRDAIQAKTRALVEEGAAMYGPLTPEHEEAVNNIFKVLHGWYGNVFFSRYVSGILVEEGPNKGDDEGMVNARRMWAFALRTFSGATIKAALGATRAAHPEFPPNLPQFEALCRARAPRRVLRDKDAVAQIEMGQPLRSHYARKAREINARHDARAKATRDGYRQIEPGLAGLKEAIASAVGAAGGDEAETLLRLDRDLSPKANHE